MANRRRRVYRQPRVSGPSSAVITYNVDTPDVWNEFRPKPKPKGIRLRKIQDEWYLQRIKLT